MHRVSDVPVVVFNPHLTCSLCKGYLIDATTVVECLHSFCRSCILTYLQHKTTCPVCETLLHKTKPHYAIRPDRALQAIVYKLIPNLFEKEMLSRRKFYEAHPSLHSRSLSPEKRGDISINTYVLPEEDRLSIELRYWDQNEDNIDDSGSKFSSQSDLSILPPVQPTFLLCPPELTVGHIEKLIRMKFNLKPSEHDVSVFFSADDLFNPDHTLSDLACLYAWRRQQPFKLYFTIKQATKNESPVLIGPQSPTKVGNLSEEGMDKSNLLNQNTNSCSLKQKSKNLPVNPVRKKHVDNHDFEASNHPSETSVSNSQTSTKSSCKISLPTQFMKSISLSSPMLNTPNSVCSSLA
uniref:RING-type domain-containing protein n=1 Tax=Trichobilharzia regenti TaxID=157069 RepID=A0AA85INP9_TRIRE|nr:unnamed protein product [Trichobilharzia regenti]